MQEFGPEALVGFMRFWGFFLLKMQKELTG